MTTSPEAPEIYCLKCKAKTGSKDVQAVILKNGRPATSAICVDWRHQEIPHRRALLIGHRLGHLSRFHSKLPQKPAATLAVMARHRNEFVKNPSLILVGLLPVATTDHRQQFLFRHPDNAPAPRGCLPSFR